jgi:hypothetical protein
MKSVLMIMIAVCVACNSGNSKKDRKEVFSDETTSKKALPDTIKTLCGFYMGMTEKEIRNYVKNNHDKFYLDNKYRMNILRSKIDDLPYEIHFTLTRGKLTDIIFICEKEWGKIDDIEFKEHYKNIYTRLKGLNEYAAINDLYYKQAQVEWPSAYDGRTINMAEFHVDNNMFYNSFNLNIGQNEETKNYYLIIYFSGSAMASEDPKFRKPLEFDKL